VERRGKVTLPEPVTFTSTTERERTMVGRRRFLLLGIGGTAAALVGAGTLQASAASPTMVPVWRLSADWGYPVPPKSRTRCRCTACRNHAANKVFATKALALANRIHPCCVCQPYSIDILASDSVALFASSPDGSIDLRNDQSRGLFEAAVVRSLAPVPDPTPPTTPATPTVPSPAPAIAPAATPATASGPDPVPDPVSELAADPSRSVSAPEPVTSHTASLPVTGSNSEVLLAAAGVLVIAGAAAVVAAGSPNEH
jgi:LPXTG-motif cell wall-anchored protein